MQDKIIELVEIGKPVLLTDIDGVLTRYYEDLVAESKARWGVVYDINEDHTKLWGVGYDEGLRRLQELRDDGFYSRLGHDEDAVEVLEDLSETYTIVAVTSRPIHLEQITSEWLEDRYGKSIHLTMHAGIFDDHTISYEQQLRSTKAGLVRRLRNSGVNVAWFVDDEPKHAGGVASETGMSTIHARKDWHSLEVLSALPKNVVCLDNWKQIHTHIRMNGPGATTMFVA